MTNSSQNLQDLFLNQARKQKSQVTVYLVNGIKLQGIVTSFDNFTILLKREGQVQLIYKHAVSTILPGDRLNLSDDAEAKPQVKVELKKD